MKYFADLKNIKLYDYDEWVYEYYKDIFTLKADDHICIDIDADLAQFCHEKGFFHYKQPKGSVDLWKASELAKENNCHSVIVEELI